MTTLPCANTSRIWRAPPSKAELFARGLAVLAVLFFLFALALSVQAQTFTPRGLGGGGGMFVPGISPYNPNLMLLACDMGGVYRSEDKGRTWSLIPTDQGLRGVHLSPRALFLKDRIYWVSARSRICLSRDNGRTWVFLPPGPWKNSPIVAFSFQDKTEQLLVSTEVGIWQGYGDTWKPVSQIKGGPVLAVDDTLYAALGDGSLLVSQKGVPWRNAGNLGGPVTALAGRQEGDRHTLLASVQPQGLMLSEDNGVSWRTVKSPYANETVLELPPGRSDFYALQTSSVATASLLHSADQGATWNNLFRMAQYGKQRGHDDTVNTSWVQASLVWGYYFTSGGLAVSASEPGCLVVTTQGEVYITRDNGANWDVTMSTSLPPLPDGTPRFASSGLEVTSCWGYAFDPHDPQREYIAYTDVGFARSLDQGASWMWAGKGSPWRNTFYDLAFDPDRPGRLYAAASQRHDIPHYSEVSATSGNNRAHRGGVVVSDDYGATWKVPYAPATPNGLPNLVCTTVVLDPTSPPDRRTLYAGMFGEGDDDQAGVYVSHDSGATWSRLNPGPGILPNLHIYRLRLHPKTGHLYCLITGLRAVEEKGGFFATQGGIWRSENKGESWHHLSAGMPLNRWATAFAFDPADNKALYVTAASPAGGANVGGVHKMVNDGKTWFHILNDGRMTTVAGQPNYDHTMAVTVHPNNPNLIFVGTTLHGLLYSFDRGKFWRKYREFPFANVQSITVNPHNPKRILVTTFGGGVWEGPVPENPR